MSIKEFKVSQNWINLYHINGVQLFIVSIEFWIKDWRYDESEIEHGSFQIIQSIYKSFIKMLEPEKPRLKPLNTNIYEWEQVY